MVGGFKVKLKLGGSAVVAGATGKSERPVSDAGRASHQSPGPGPIFSADKEIRKEPTASSKKRARKEESDSLAGEPGNPDKLVSYSKPPKAKHKVSKLSSVAGDRAVATESKVTGKKKKTPVPKTAKQDTMSNSRVMFAKSAAGSDSSAGMFKTGKKKTKPKVDKVKVKLRDQQPQAEDSAATISAAEGGLFFSSNFSDPGFQEADSMYQRDWDTVDSTGNAPSDGEPMHESASTSNLTRRELMSPEGGSQGFRIDSPTPTQPLDPAPKPPGPPKKELEKIVDKIQKKDAYEIFKDPVTEDVAPGYFSIVQNPMDFSTMRSKIFEDKYSSWEELESDLMLMFDNAMLYNGPDTIYHQLAVSMKNLASKLVELGKQGVQSFRGRTAAIMRAHNIAQEVSVAKALAAEKDAEEYYGEGVAIDFGKSQGGRREKELPAVRPSGEDFRSTYLQVAGPVAYHGLAEYRNGASSEGVAFATQGIVMRPVLPFGESAYLRSASRFIAGLKGSARTHALASVVKSVAPVPVQP